MQSLLQYHRLNHKVRDGYQHCPDTTGLHHLVQVSSGSSVVSVLADGEDGTDPRRWQRIRRIRATVIVWLLVFSQGWVSTSTSKITKSAAHEFHVLTTMQMLATALFMIGLGLGALVAGPVSETIGRNPVYLSSTLLLLSFCLGTALSPNIGAEITFRFLSGLASSPTLSIYGGSLADMFDKHQRRSIWPVFALAPLLGPLSAPVANAWMIQQGLSWRWPLEVALAFAGSAFLLALSFLPETYSPILLLWKARCLRKVYRDDRFAAPIEQAEALPRRLKRNLKQPFNFFRSELIIILLGGYLILILFINLNFLSGFGVIFSKTYGLSTGTASLAFVSIAGGISIDVALTPLYIRLARRILWSRLRIFVSKKYWDREDTGVEKTYAELIASPPPEMSLLRAFVGAPFLPISLFWLGWTNNPSISPASGYIAATVYGYSFSAIFLSAYQYIIDSYETHSSSALGSITTARYLIAGPLCVATKPMYKALGVSWSLTVVGTIGLLLVPVPWALMRYGHVVRQRSAVARTIVD
ncbi:MFS general substrate transporter [Lecanosticta acicola]|uniref:MFS general substrate transporter n=1 Tax=Lecanosticta acicola TaxID=111012 RepID=A0AAI9E9J9_9PEZI|nr:MFS general substrate transporter [Lecanosticta acicola]